MIPGTKSLRGPEASGNWWEPLEKNHQNVTLISGAGRDRKAGFYCYWDWRIDKIWVMVGFIKTILLPLRRFSNKIEWEIRALALLKTTHSVGRFNFLVRGNEKHMKQKKIWIELFLRCHRPGKLLVGNALEYPLIWFY